MIASVSQHHSTFAPGALVNPALLVRILSALFAEALFFRTADLPRLIAHLREATELSDRRVRFQDRLHARPGAL